MRSIKLISIIVVVFCIGFRIILLSYQFYSVVVQNDIIDSSFRNGDFFDYLGYIEIPKFNIRRLIKDGTDNDVLDSLFVGLFELSHSIDSSDLIILAGHNVSNVFSCLHDLISDDYIYIGYKGGVKKFIVYDKKVVSEYDDSYFYNRKNELLLITCDKKGYRLLVFLKEDL